MCGLLQVWEVVYGIFKFFCNTFILFLPSTPFPSSNAVFGGLPISFSAACLFHHPYLQLWIFYVSGYFATQDFVYFIFNIIIGKQQRCAAVITALFRSIIKTKGKRMKKKINRLQLLFCCDSLALRQSVNLSEQTEALSTYQCCQSRFCFLSVFFFF